MATHHALPTTPWGKTFDRIGDTAVALTGAIGHVILGATGGGLLAGLIIALIQAGQFTVLATGGGLLFLAAGVIAWYQADPPAQRPSERPDPGCPSASNTIHDSRKKRDPA